MIYNVSALLSGEVGKSRVYAIDDESITHDGGDFHGISGDLKPWGLGSMNVHAAWKPQS